MVEAYFQDKVFSSVFSRWNENLSDSRFAMDVGHVLTLHHTRVCVQVFVTYQTQISLLFEK